MKIKLTTIKAIKNSVTKRAVSLGALVLLCKNAEEYIQKKIIEAEKELLKINELRKTQGLREKQRIDDEVVEEVLNRDE